jgi:hypothetical protein
VERSTARRTKSAAAIACVASMFLALTAAHTASIPQDLVEDGERHFGAGLFEPAERAFRDALAHDAQWASAHRGLARTLLARHELAQARSEAEVAVQLSPEWPEAHLTLATVADHAGDSPRAADALERFLELAPVGDQGIRRTRALARRAVLRAIGTGAMHVIDDHKISTTRVEIVQDKVILKASINGGVPIDVVLDTGAEYLVVSERTVQRAGLQRVRGGGTNPSLEMTVVDTLDIGGTTVRRVPALIRRESLRVVANRGGDAFSPLSVGLSMIIDYARSELILGQRLPFEPADVELPLYVLGLPVVMGTSGADPVSFVLDTGSEITAASTATIERATVPAEARRIPMRLFDTWGTRQRDAVLLTPGIDLTFGAIQLKEYPVVVRSWPDVHAIHGFEMGGILGHNFLRRYRVTIDLARRVVRLKRQLPERPTAPGAR